MTKNALLTNDLPHGGLPHTRLLGCSFALALILAIVGSFFVLAGTR
ncbi:hypothetical protein ACFL55_01715 [Candidatus Latescibacterota bacterium]